MLEKRSIGLTKRTYTSKIARESLDHIGMGSGVPQRMGAASRASQ
jgi:hypothetical protein